MSVFLFIGSHNDEFQGVEKCITVQFPSRQIYFYSIKEYSLDQLIHIQPDVILLEYTRQNKSLEICQLLKNNILGKYIPILLIGKDSCTSNDRAKAMDAGAEAFISKPIDEHELVAILNMLLRLKIAEDSLRKSNKELKQQVQRTSDELHLKEKRYSDMFDAAGNIIILIGKNREIIEWNKSAAQILEIPKYEALGKDFEEIITNKVMRADINDRFSDSFDSENQLEYQVNIRTGTDQKYQILWTLSQLKDDGNHFQSILLIGQNVSQRVKDERERKKSEAKLRSNYLFLNTLMNSLPSLVYYKNTNGEYLGCNSNFADFHETTPEEIVGQHIHDLVSHDEANEIIAEDNIVFETGQKQVKQISKRFRDGKVHHFIINKTAFQNPDQSIGGLVGVMVDITKIKEMETALQESEMFFKGITDSANDAIIITDKKNKIQFWNKAAEMLFGYRREEIINKNIYQIIIPLEEASKLEEHLQTIINEKEKPEVSNSLEINTIAKNGQLFPAEFSNSTIYLNKKLSVIYIARNIGLRKQAENMLREAKEKAEEADRLKTAFLSNMSHEIRTPMNAIVGFSQLLANNSLSEEKRHLFIDQININSESLLNLIEDIIYVSKIESGKIEIKMEYCQLNSILDEIYTSFKEHRRRMSKDEVRIELEKGIENPNFSFLSDNQRFRQIMTNLIGNALKFTESGFVSFGYRIKDENNLLFFVKDTGLGINPEKLNYIFDRFTKIAANKTKLYGGTGLGLSITKHLVEELGGQIWVESEADKGSTFYFLLPYQGRSSEHQQVSVIKEKYESKSLRNINILIAEDEHMNYLFLQEALSPTGAKLTWARNGKEAVNLIESMQEFDVILMDMKMPIMDGYEATRIIKGLKPKIKIIAQTAYAMPEEQKKGYQAGCDFYLSKPIDPLVLLDALRKHLPVD